MKLERFTRVIANRLMEDVIGHNGIAPCVTILGRDHKMAVATFTHERELDKQAVVLSELGQFIHFCSALCYAIVIESTVIIREEIFETVKVLESDERLRVIVVYGEAVDRHHVRILKAIRDDKGTILQLEELPGKMISAAPFPYEGLLKEKPICH